MVKNFFPERTGPVMQAPIDNAAATMASAGATVKDVMLPAGLRPYVVGGRGDRR